MAHRNDLPGIKGGNSGVSSYSGSDEAGARPVPKPRGATTSPDAADGNTSVGSGISGSGYGSATTHVAGIPGIANDSGIHDIESAGNAARANPARPKVHAVHRLGEEYEEPLIDVGTPNFTDR